MADREPYVIVVAEALPWVQRWCNRNGLNYRSRNIIPLTAATWDKTSRGVRREEGDHLVILGNGVPGWTKTPTKDDPHHETLTMTLVWDILRMAGYDPKDAEFVD